MFFKFSTLLRSPAAWWSLLKETKFIVLVFSTLTRLLPLSFFMEFETAVGDTLRIFANSLWLSFSPALMQSKENISCSSVVHLILYMSILIDMCTVKFIILLI